MTKIYCDACGKELPKNYHASIFGYDACPSKLCHARLVLKAHALEHEATSTAMKPNDEQVEAARKTVAIYRGKL